MFLSGFGLFFPGISKSDESSVEQPNNQEKPVKSLSEIREIQEGKTLSILINKLVSVHLESSDMHVV